MLIEVLATPPIVTAALLPATQKLGSFSAGYLKVRLAVSGSAVAVRPYYERDGRWWPLRADAVAGVGIEPVTADPTIRGGLSEALYASSHDIGRQAGLRHQDDERTDARAYLETVEQ